MEPDERRRDPRSAVFEMYDVVRPDERLRAEIEDISRSGLRVVCDEALEPHAIVLLRIAHVDLHLRAVVVWARPLEDGRCHAGLEFVNLESDERAFLGEHVDAIEEARMRAESER